MKLSKLLLFITINALTLFASQGNGAGGGTDTMKLVRVWFLGPDKTISSCIKVSPQFGVSDAKVSEEIRTAFKTWETYITKKKIKWELGDIPAPTTNVEIHLDCTGNEDLVFYLGVEDEQVKAAKTHYLNPYGIAEQVSYDKFKGWSKGFIWVALPDSISKGVPNWKLPQTLRGILIHEIGHTLGNGHVEGTIMDENFGLSIRDQNEWGQWSNLLVNIDQSRELYVCRECPGAFFASHFDTFPPEMEYLRRAMKKLTGQEPTGKMEAHFEMTIVNMKPQGQLQYFSADRSVYQFTLNTSSEISLGHLGGTTFQAELAQVNGPWTIASKGTWGYSFYGSLTDGKKTWPVIVNRNLLGRVDIVEAESGLHLFTSYGS